MPSPHHAGLPPGWDAAIRSAPEPTRIVVYADAENSAVAIEFCTMKVGAVITNRAEAEALVRRLQAAINEAWPAPQIMTRILGVVG